MSKKTREEKREEERRIIAEMGLSQKAEKTKAQKKRERKERVYDDSMPEKIHCKRCRTLMEKGVCPACGFKIYVPMDKKKREKISLILFGIGMAVFVVIFLLKNVI